MCEELLALLAADWRCSALEASQNTKRLERKRDFNLMTTRLFLSQPHLGHMTLGCSLKNELSGMNKINQKETGAMRLLLIEVKQSYCLTAESHFVFSLNVNS